MEGTTNKLNILFLILAVLGIVGTITFLWLYLAKDVNQEESVISPPAVVENRTEIASEKSVGFHPISLQVKGEELFLWPTSYQLQYGNTVFGTLKNISLTGSPFNDQWFYQTTNPDIIGVTHKPDTYVGWNEVAYVNPAAMKGVTVLNSWSYNNLHEFKPVASSITFSSPEFLNDLPITHDLSVNINDENCATIPETTEGGSMVDVQQWLQDCNQNYPLSLSEIRVDDKVAYTLPEQQVVRGSGPFEGLPIKYILSEKDSAEIRIHIVGVSSGLDVTYFTLLGRTYSIDSDGHVLQVDLPSDMVTMTNERY